jgi:hypothetical protein
MSGMLVLIVGCGLILAACGSSGGPVRPGTRRLASSCLPPAFKISGRRPPPVRELSTRLAVPVRSRFAIFRRSAVPSDVLSGLKLDGDGLGRELSKLYELAAYYPAYVRQLMRLPDGRRYFVIPAYGRTEAVLPAHCLPAGERERRVLLEQQHRRPAEALDCIIEIGDAEDASPAGCEPFAASYEADRVFEPGLYKAPIVELAPDGVASVRIAYRETPPIVVRVSENAFWFTPPPPVPRVAAELGKLEPQVLAGHSGAGYRHLTLQWDKAVRETEPTKIEWLDRAGGLVHTISHPYAAGRSPTSVGDLRAPIQG